MTHNAASLDFIRTALASNDLPTRWNCIFSEVIKEVLLEIDFQSQNAMSGKLKASLCLMRNADIHLRFKWDLSSELEKINSLSSPFIPWMPGDWDASYGGLGQSYALQLRQAIWRYHVLGHKTYKYGVVPETYSLAKRLFNGEPLPCLAVLRERCAQISAESDSAMSGMYDSSDESGSD